ncbi:hypothetical protein [Pseudovibrio brasiliensis]|uniref:Uncharacterized protein n=1 Tax=Pseudovibrio brasiliensis TaxID=1898042 RepID=A0ABX8AQZ7_9HYPH|nr:hypothetical protein [Pseudovibrio brasiliensis]QUS57150.1 hypothetical protein KGB56_07100 [Pseudovibrio brasiliensis]
MFDDYANSVAGCNDSPWLITSDNWQDVGLFPLGFPDCFQNILLSDCGHAERTTFPFMIRSRACRFNGTVKMIIGQSSVSFRGGSETSANDCAVSSLEEELSMEIPVLQHVNLLKAPVMTASCATTGLSWSTNTTQH